MKLFNTLTKQKEEFVPRIPGKVKIYVCGPTVYDFLHIGNFRGPVVFNLLRNWLEASGFAVEMALNFTDIDDRIINRSVKEKLAAHEISERYIREYLTDFQSLGLKPHEHNPKVSESLDAIESLVKNLIEKGHAYVAEGEVLFSVRSFKDYGKLSHRNLDDMKAGIRVEIDPKKRDPMDFALWKPAKEGEPSWPSPWSAGRPGWHIECSAMIDQIFGGEIDIHGGGTDLIFPHHENEIAQSEASGKAFAKYWVHWQMLNFSGSKMSKSVGNILSLRDFLSSYHPEIYKYMILSVHYRSLTDFGDAAIEKAIRELARFYSCLDKAHSFKIEVTGPVSELAKGMEDPLWEKISAALNDDLSMPEVMAVLFDWVRNFNTQVKVGTKPNPKASAVVVATLNIFKKLGTIAALFAEEPSNFLRYLDDILLKNKKLERAAVDKLVQERWQAKSAKDYKKADELRAQLTAMGIWVMDTPEASTWEVEK